MVYKNERHYLILVMSIGLMLAKQISAKGSKGEREWRRGCTVINVCKQVHV